MKHRIDALLMEEADKFRFRFSCNDCAHFVAATQGCAEGFPNDEHRTRPLVIGETLTFCKLFELS